jgi:hypothetical protein
MGESAWSVMKEKDGELMGSDNPPRGKNWQDVR